MADTLTTNYDLTKIEVGASEDSWGAKINANSDAIDAQLKVNADAVVTAVGNAPLKANNLSDLPSAATARTNLGLVVGTDIQAFDAGLLSIAGLSTVADQMVYTTAPDTYATAVLTDAGRDLLDDADASAQRTTLGLGTAATTEASDYATAAQGAKADDALPAASLPIKAWVNFDGDGGITLRGNSNISGVVRNSAGNYTVSFTTPLANVNYGVMASGSRAGFSLAAVAGVPSGGTKTVNAVQIVCDNGAGVLSDSDDLTVMILG